jgi:peptidyl-prolyl cis-trans isomerase C
MATSVAQWILLHLATDRRRPPTNQRTDSGRYPRRATTYDHRLQARDTLSLPVSDALAEAGGNSPNSRKNKEPVMRAKARHILVPSEDDCLNLKTQIEGGGEFADLAREHSQCPSGKDGGALGEFSPGQMVREFDEVVFTKDVGMVHGPVKTQFGYHLIEITERTE